MKLKLKVSTRPTPRAVQKLNQSQPGGKATGGGGGKGNGGGKGKKK
jgi:hypothetical protein